MPKGFIDTIQLGRAEGTFSGTIVEADGEPMGSFSDVAIVTEAGKPIKSPEECFTFSFVEFRYEGGVEGNPIKKITRLTSVKTDPARGISEDSSKILRRASKAVGKDDRPIIGHVVIVKG